MSEQSEHIASFLPFAAPDGRDLRALLFVIRRMAIHGLNDAHASHALFCRFGRQYRRPQLLLRAFLLDVARSSLNRLHIAPCCSWRMTSEEAMLLESLCLARCHSEQCFEILSACLGTTNCLGLISSAQAVNQAFADLGCPLS